MTGNLIVFAKEPLRGKVKTRLGSFLGPAAALNLYKALLTSTINLASREFSGRVHWFIDGDPSALGIAHSESHFLHRQGTGDLGERMRDAFAVVFAESPGPTAIIGADCPELDGGVITQLFAHLEKGADAAIVPASDGGYAALALAKRFDAVFEGVPWSSPLTFQRTMEKLDEEGLKTAILPPLSDVDREADLPGLVELFLNDPKRFKHFKPVLDSLGVLPGAPPSVVDDLGRAVLLQPSPQRIGSLVPSVTETLFDLGVGERVIARTEFCISPENEVAKIPTVGGPKSLDLTKLLSLNPDLVFADAEENSREEVEFLIERGIRVFVALPRDIPDVCAFLRRAGKLVGGYSLAQKSAQELALFRGPATSHPSVCLIWMNPLMTVSASTLPGALMEAAGFKCLVPAGEPCYPVITFEELRRLSPSLLLLPSEPYPFSSGEATALEEKTGAKGIRFPGEWVTWYTTRTAENLRKLSGVLRKQGTGGKG